ncbi:glycosyltransferase [Baaleninema simplex]|uniref:glycosyltransferase n=1 Tax=Baaleninema simplex TaxID=2862350 RepID=UPI00034878D9|nr:glycosyltransferase [Baaleninema simplex]
MRNETQPTISHPEIPQFGETLQTPLFSTLENSQVSATPILSVVIPCYNDGEYLEDAIRSVETYPEPIYEILIVNDGSTDSLTLAVLENLRQRGYRILNQPNRGLAAARNRGIEDARGRYILPLDADNRIRHEYIEKGIEILDRIPSVGVVYGDVLLFGTRNHIHHVPPFDLERLLQGNYIDACAVFRKQVWREVGGYDTEIPENLGYEDWEFWLSVAEKDWQFYKVSEVLFEYRMRSDSMVNACNIPENREKLFSYICQKHRSLYESRWLRVLVEKESATLREKLRVDSLRQQLRQFQQRLREDLGLSKTPISSQPLVSVCIPTYNGSRFLEEALASVEKQTYPNLEIIVADDGSTDETVELIESFRDKLETPLRLFRNSRLGMVRNWNFCLEMVTGKYIKFLFQDDVLSPRCIEAMVELAESDGDIGLVFAPRILLLSDDAEEIPELMEVYQICRDVHRGWTKLESIQEGSRLLDDWQLLESPINKIGEPTAVLIRKSAVETVGNFDVELRQLVDVEMWWRILTRFKVGFLDTPLSYFRLHPRQQTFRHAVEGGFDEDALLKKVVESSRFSPRLRLEAVCRSLAFGELANWEGWLCRLIPQVAASALRRLYSRGLREAVFREATVLEVGEFPETVNAAARGLLEMRWRRFEMSLVEIPSWLVGDYVTLATSQLPQWRELGEGKAYFRRLWRLTETLLEAVMENPESAVWREAAMGFSLNVCFAPLYYIDVDFSELLAKRWRLLKFALSTHQHDLDWEFSPTPSGKIGVLWGMSRKPSSWEILHLVASRWVKAKSDVCCEEVSENSGFLESQPEFRVSRGDVSQWRVSEIPGFVETQRDSRVSRGDVSQWRVSEIPGFVESQFKRDVSRGESSQPGIGIVAENRDFLENPPQPDVSRGELSESEVSTTGENLGFLENPSQPDVSRGESSESGVSENLGFVESQFKQDVSRGESSQSETLENPRFLENPPQSDVSKGESSQSETGENLGFLENPPQPDVSKGELSQSGVSTNLENLGFLENPSQPDVSRGESSQSETLENPQLFESQFKQDVSKGELSQSGVSTTGENLRFLENPSQPNVSREESSESGVSENPRFLENPPQSDVSKGEFSQSGVSTNLEKLGFLENPSQPDVSRGESSQSGVSTTGENLRFLENPPQPDVSRGESSESGVSENPQLFESQFKQDVSKGELSQAGVSTTGENLRFLENPSQPDVSREESFESETLENLGFVESQFKQDVSREESFESETLENLGFVESQFKQDVSREESSESETLDLENPPQSDVSREESSESETLENPGFVESQRDSRVCREELSELEVSTTEKNLGFVDNAEESWNVFKRLPTTQPLEIRVYSFDAGSEEDSIPWISLPLNLRGQVRTLRNDDLDMLFVCGEITATTTPLTLLSVHHLARYQEVLEEIPELEMWRRSPDLVTNATKEFIEQHLSQYTYSVPATREKVNPDFDLKSRLGLSDETQILLSYVYPDGLTAEWREIWATILDRTPDTLLVLALCNLEHRNLLQINPRDRISETLQHHQLDRSRVLLLNSINVDTLNSLYSQANIYLDNFPNSPILGIQKALEFELPIVTKTGHDQTHAKFLKTVNFQGAIAPNSSNYIDRTLELISKAKHVKYF